MVREIVRDVIFLGQKSTDATVADIKTAMDLVDTLEANRNACVGMAANMIGVKKRIIAINDNGFTKLMINPTITAKSSKFETEEGCLSLSGVRPTTRYKNITVMKDSKQVNADWNETDETSKAYILNKPEIPDAQVQADSEDTYHSRHTPDEIVDGGIDTCNSFHE